MVYIALGLVGCLLMWLPDLAALRRIGVLRPFLWLVGVLIVFYSMIMISISGSTFDLPFPVSSLGWFLAAISLCLIVYSILLELPHIEASYRLVTTGTWALVRHPPILWSALLLIGLVLISRSRLMLIAAPVWWVAGLLYAWLEERFLLSKTFPNDYENYKETTPMLIPTKKSFERCLRTLKVPRRG